VLLQIQPLLTWTEIVVRLLSVVALIFLNAFFVTVEFSIVSARRSRINQLAASGDTQARTVQKLQRKLNSLLSTTQLGITLSSLALGWIGEHTMAALIIHWLARLPISDRLTQFLSHSIALPLAFLLLAYLQIVLGELCPKSVALSYPEQISRFLGPPSLTIARLLNPFVWLLNWSTAFLLSAVGIKENNASRYGGVTPEELRLLINTSTEVPELKKGEREILSNVFEFRAAFVEEIMVPRTQIASIHQEATFQDLLDEIVNSKHSLYPVTGESLDNILGTIDFRDLAIPLSMGELTTQSSIEPWIMPAKVVPETLPLSDLLTQMQQTAKEMVIVVDEYGGTAGIVTFQDLTAKIIGEAASTESSGQIIYKDSHTVIFPARTDLEEVNERLSLALPTSENYLTLGGFVIFELQKIPQVNEQLIYRDLELTVIAAEGPKLTQIKIHRSGRALVRGNLGAPANIKRTAQPSIERQARR